MDFGEWWQNRNWKTKLAIIASAIGITYMATIQYLPSFAPIAAFLGFAVVIAKDKGVKGILGTFALLLALDLMLPPSGYLDSLLYQATAGFAAQPQLQWLIVYPVTFAALVFAGIYLATTEEAK